ncbi:hypothetical protein BDF19DRAFT_441376 [Syncephalis fuscata]|nr:hypothetical protein BDF19DRAFT_441376 [Syncephalis fuscata]
MAEETKSANFNPSFHQLHSVIAGFDTLRNAINVPASFAGITGAQLATLSVELLRVNELLFGQQAGNVNLRGPKLPVHLLDASKLTSDAPVLRLIQETLLFCAGKNCHDLQLSQSVRVDDLLALFGHLRSVAINAGWWRIPRITFEETLALELQQKITEMVHALGGELTANHQDATHIIVPNAEETANNDQEWYRVVDRRDGMVRVHWGYFPDSYDSWLSESEDIKGDAEPEPVITPPRPVLFRWLEDSVKFHEWMNEEDYEPDSSTSLSRQPTAHTTISKRVAGDIEQNASDKRPRHDMDEELGAAGRNKRAELEPLTSGHQLNASHTVTMSHYNCSGHTAMSLGDNEPMAQVKEETPQNASIVGDGAVSGNAMAVDASGVASVKKQYTDEDARRFLSQQTQEVIIPSYAAWFSFDNIHDIEKNALPEFFNNKNRSKTPTVYKDYRDFMINTNRLNPVEYLTVTACRRNLAGDVCTIMRVHAFLEQWGLINYQVDAETRPSLVAPPFTGHFRVTVDTPRGLQPFLPAAKQSTAKPPGQMPPATPKLGGATNLTGGNMDLRKNIYDAQASAADTSRLTTNGTEAKVPAKYHCSTCGVECTVLRYHHMKNKLFDVCPNCYRDGRFPSNMFSGDFIRIASQQETPSNTWSDEETLRLLEALDMFEDDWNRISDHVRTKTREQCILHFLQLPIEEPFLGAREGDLGPLQYAYQPFSQADNPVMSVVAFLASVVNPGVAAAAAQSALKELSKKDKKTSKSTGEDADGDTAMGEEEVEEKPVISETTTATNNETTTERSMDQSTVTRAANAALGAAAAKAKVLADYEEREVQRLVYAVVESQMKKLELKMNQLEELEQLLEQERQELDRERQQVLSERLALRNATLAISNSISDNATSTTSIVPAFTGTAAPIVTSNITGMSTAIVQETDTLMETVTTTPLPTTTTTTTTSLPLSTSSVAPIGAATSATPANTTATIITTTLLQ